MSETIYKIGFWSGLVAFTSALAFVIVQLLQVVDVFSFPLNEILIYVTSLCIVILFVLEILELHYVASEDKKIYSHAALIFSIIYAMFATSNYVVQLATVIPMQLKRTLQEVQVLKQTPHSLFWDFDAIGYICMGREITQMETKRYMDDKRKETWVINPTNCVERSGTIIPTKAEVFWRLKEGDFSYAKFNVTTIEYNKPEKF